LASDFQLQSVKPSDSQHESMGVDLLKMEPVPTLLRRVRAELSAEFAPGKPLRVSRAPGRLDVMGGIADYTGSLVTEATLDRAAAVVLQERTDRAIQIFSFNLLDEHQPFTFQMPIDALVTQPLEKLKQGFAEPGRRWAAYLAGCLFVLHEAGIVNLSDPNVKGLNLALYSTVPMGAGVGSSAAIETATMMNLVEHFQVRDRLDPMEMSALCQRVENRLVGAPCGIMDQVSSCYGQADSLLRMVCQPHEIQPPLRLPAGTRVIGLDSRVKHSVGDGMYGKTRCAAFMGHKIILHQIEKIGRAAKRELVSDPMGGYLANLDPEDYKRTFREHLPESIKGAEFLDRYGPTVDLATVVEPDVSYHVQHAADHHVLEARRVRRFVEFLEQANLSTGPARKLLLDKAGHLMYASHLSYTNDAMLGADECDLLVKLVRERESAGLYGAKITGGGSGGTVAMLAEQSSSVDSAVEEIMSVYQHQTGIKPEALVGTSPGAWHVGTKVV
jgi:galactokinase